MNLAQNAGGLVFSMLIISSYLSTEFHNYAIDFMKPRHSSTEDVELFPSESYNRR